MQKDPFFMLKCNSCTVISFFFFGVEAKGKREADSVLAKLNSRTLGGNFKGCEYPKSFRQLFKQSLKDSFAFTWLINDSGGHRSSAYGRDRSQRCWLWSQAWLTWLHCFSEGCLDMPLILLDTSQRSTQYCLELHCL